MIDCDVHVTPPTADELQPYLEPHWRDYVRDIGFKGGGEAMANSYPLGTTGLSLASAAVRAGPAAADAAPLPDGVTHAVMTCYTGVEAIRHPDFAHAIARAINDWQADRMLADDARRRGSVVVSLREPARAAEEIRRMAADPRFVQVLLPVRSERPYGNRSYFPVFEAAAECGLVAAIHFGGFSENPSTASGWPDHYIEDYVVMAHTFQVQLTSLIVEGVFERFPELRVSLLESGITWLAPHLWRLDKEWKGLRRETPWVKELPSRYVHRHVRLTIQPVDAPQPGSLDVEMLLDHLGSDELLLYASDTPHDHGEDPEDFLGLLPADIRDKVLTANAAAWYRLEGAGDG